MPYRIIPNGEIWNGGVFCVPKAVTEKSLKFASENQLKALLYLLSNNGTAEPAEIAKALGISEAQAAECLDFWVYEGVLSSGSEAEAAPVEKPEPKPEKRALESLPMPSLTPRDVVNLCAENAELASLLRAAESILATSLSISMKSNLINMVTYYGLPVSVVVTLLEYYKSERDAGRNITTRTLQQIAKDWANEEISTIEQASEKLLEMAESEKLWLRVLELCEFDYRQPTQAQLKMLRRWRNDFEPEMIFFACNVMKKYTEEEKRSLKAIDNILKDWKRKGLKTPDEVKNQPKPDSKKDKKKSKPSFDIEEIKKNSDLNDDFDI
ncbi:MAG: DnaD domain protein [Eubacterium sp.]|nr:DnaD domain protein [Eubacterium sp.]